MPKKIDLAERKQTITRAAISVIGDVGLEGARLRDVARAADVTTGSVTHYFDGKEAVLEAALEEVVKGTLSRIQAAEVLNKPGELSFFMDRICFDLPIEEGRRQEWRVWLAFWGRAIVDERLRAIHQTYYRAFVEGLKEPLRQLCLQDRQVTDAELIDCADAVISVIDGIGTRATLEPEDWPANRQCGQLKRMLTPLLTDFIKGK